MADEKVARARRDDNFIDLTSNVFGRLTVKAFHHKDKWRASFWLCACLCGNEVVVCGKKLRNGRTRSCGCLRKDTTAKRATSHGNSKSRTYRIWSGMLTRCYNPNATSYERYGGRGINVCDRWKSFNNFLEDMAECPDGCTIERRDNNGNYSPDNCYWTTRKQQARNTSNNLLIEYNGKIKSLSEWTEELGIPYHSVKSRLYRGQDPQMAFSANHQRLHLVEHGGETKSIADWAAELGLNYSTLRSRLRKGWPPHLALVMKKRISRS